MEERRKIRAMESIKNKDKDKPKEKMQVGLMTFVNVDVTSSFPCRTVLNVGENNLLISTAFLG